MKKLFNEQNFINEIDKLSKFLSNTTFSTPVFRITESDSKTKIEKGKEFYIDYFEKNWYLKREKTSFYVKKYEDYHDYYFQILSREDIIKIIQQIEQQKRIDDLFS